MDEESAVDRRRLMWIKAEPGYHEVEHWQEELENEKDKRIKELERELYVLKKRRYKVK